INSQLLYQLSYRGIAALRSKPIAKRQREIHLFFAKPLFARCFTTDLIKDQPTSPPPPGMRLLKRFQAKRGAAGRSKTRKIKDVKRRLISGASNNAIDRALLCNRQKKTGASWGKRGRYSLSWGNGGVSSWEKMIKHCAQFINKSLTKSTQFKVFAFSA
ncbi:MAG: hypothetical protein AAGC95_01320, partial [Pseudomonadota bacterium]